MFSSICSTLSSRYSRILIYSRKNFGVPRNIVPWPRPLRPGAGSTVIRWRLAGGGSYYRYYCSKFVMDNVIWAEVKEEGYYQAQQVRTDVMS